MPITAGILMVVSCLNLVVQMIFLGIDGFITFLPLVISTIIAGIIVIIGGIKAIDKSGWMRAILGSISSLFISVCYVIMYMSTDLYHRTPKLVLTINWVTLCLCIVAIVMIIISRKQFQKYPR